jgi:hypothetical protein
MARTGTFVARIDDELLRDMTREQLEGVAERAWRRAHAPIGDDARAESEEMRLRLSTRDLDAMRRIVEPRLADVTKRWRIGPVTSAADGIDVVDYYVQLRKKTMGDDLVALVRAAASTQVIHAELT